MTVIATYYDRETGHATMSADTQMTGISKQKTRKLYQCPQALVGCAGSTLGHSFLRGRGRVELSTPHDIDELASSWRHWCEVRGHIETVAGLRRYPSNFLIVIADGIFEIDDVGEPIKFEECYAAIGSGAPFAIGAMLVQHNERVDFRVVEATTVATRVAPGCAGPVRSISRRFPFAT